MDPVSEINLTEIVAILKKRILLFLALFGMVLGIDLLVTLCMPALYRASAKMIIQNEINLYPAGIMPNTAEDNIFLNTQKEIISSSFIINAALEYVKADGILKGENYESLKNRISPRFTNNTNILEVNVDLGKPKDAIALTNAIVKAFLKYHAQAKAELVDRNLDIVNKEIAVLEVNKNDLSAKLNNLRGKEQLSFFQAQIPQYINNILELNKKNLSVQADLTRLKEELEKTSNTIKSGDVHFFYPLTPSTGVVGENPTSSLTSVPWIQDLKTKLSDAQSRISRLSAEYTENNPEMLGLNNQVTLLQENIDSELRKVLLAYVDYYRGYIQFLESQQAANGQEKVRSESELNKIAKNIDTAAARQIEFNMLLKNYDTIQDIYAIFLHKRNELQMLKEQFLNSPLPNMRVFEFAAPPLKQVNPNFPLNMAVGIFLGIFIGISGTLKEEKKELSKLKAKFPPQSPGTDKRSMTRVKRSVAVAYELKENTARAKHYGVTDNISGSGLSLRLNEFLPVATELSLEIHITDKDSIRTVGQIIWVCPAVIKGTFDAGLHFIKIDPQEREKLINYVYAEHYLAEKV